MTARGAASAGLELFRARGSPELLRLRSRTPRQVQQRPVRCLGRDGHLSGLLRGVVGLPILENVMRFRTLSPNPAAFRRKALSKQLLAMISTSASDNRSSERLSLIDRRTVEASVKGNYRPLAASPSPSLLPEAVGFGEKRQIFSWFFGQEGGVPGTRGAGGSVTRCINRGPDVRLGDGGSGFRPCWDSGCSRRLLVSAE